jgi:tellurite resistance protein TehA-like permease
MGTILAPLAVCIVGALLWVLASRAPLPDMGRIAFAVGLFWTVYTLLGHPVHF